jgi:mannose-P-dolichol utilization defect protein 1
MTASSARGLSLPAYFLETAAYAITLAYSFRHHFPFSTYGENLFLTIQNILITLLIIYYAPNAFFFHQTGTIQKIIITAVFMAATGLALGTISLDLLALLQITTLPLSVFSKLPQIRQNFRSKSTGQLSAFAVVSQIAGCLARLFTTATEIGDSLVSAGFALALSLNLILGAQLWLYWGESEDSKDSYDLHPMNGNSLNEVPSWRSQSIPSPIYVPSTTSERPQLGSSIPHRLSTPPPRTPLASGSRKWARKVD